MKLYRFLLLFSLLLVSACGTKSTDVVSITPPSEAGAKNITVYKSPT